MASATATILDRLHEAHWQVAELIPRIQAAFVDCLLATGAGFLPALVLQLLLNGSTRDSGGELIMPWTGAGMWVGAALLFGLTEGRRGERYGQSPGKRALRLRTIRAHDGLPISRTQAWGRAVLLGALLPGLALPISEFARLAAGPGVALGDNVTWAVARLPRRRRRLGGDAPFACRLAVRTAVVDEAIVNRGTPDLVGPLPIIGVDRQPDRLRALRLLDRAILGVALFACFGGAYGLLTSIV